MITIILISILGLSTMAASTGTLILTGVIGQLLDISVNSNSQAQSLDLHTNTTNLEVATVTEVSNSTTGYKVSITSANGELIHEDGQAVDSFNYSLKYNGSNVDLVNGSTFSYTSSSKGTFNRSVSISYTGVNQEDLSAGMYSDTVSFTIQAN